MNKSEVLGRKIKPSTITVESGSKFIGAVFLYMFLALVITGVVAGGVGALLQYVVFPMESTAGVNIYAIVLITSLILYIPTMIWVQVSAIRKSKGMVPAYVIYAITMGILMSSFTYFIDFYQIAMAFGMTCLAFGLMALIAWFSKKNLRTAGLIASGLIFGSMMILFITLPLQFFFPGFFDPLMAGISLIMLIAVIIITAVDLRNVKEIASHGGAENNVALLCALNLYVDFVYIFIRLLALISRLKR